MKNAILRRLAAVAALGLGLAGNAFATTFSTDYTDLWWNQDESGWGINVIQQYDTIFATIFVYGTDNSPRWYVASSLAPTGTSSALAAFTGPLYQTTGPYFGAAWSGTATPTLVGSMTLTFNSYSTGTLSYVVNGVTVSKQITRQTWRGNNLTGNYLGGLTAIGTNCHGGVNNGPILVWNLLTVTQNANSNQLSMRIDVTSNSFCTFTGTYSPQGRYGTLSQGSWSCTFNGQAQNAGTFTLTQIDGTLNSLSAVFTAADQFCAYQGRFGGIRDVL